MFCHIHWQVFVNNYNIYSKSIESTIYSFKIKRLRLGSKTDSVTSNNPNLNNFEILNTLFKKWITLNSKIWLLHWLAWELHSCFSPILTFHTDQHHSTLQRPTFGTLGYQLKSSRCRSFIQEILSTPKKSWADNHHICLSLELQDQTPALTKQQL